MNGRRVYPDENGDLNLREGDYGFHPGYGCFLARVPGGHTGNLGNHQVIEHEDGTITVSPSILVSGWDYDRKQETSWHGYLERGIWREA